MLPYVAMLLCFCSFLVQVFTYFFTGSFYFMKISMNVCGHDVRGYVWPCSQKIDSDLSPNYVAKEPCRY